MDSPIGDEVSSPGSPSDLKAAPRSVTVCNVFKRSRVERAKRSAGDDERVARGHGIDGPAQLRPVEDDDPRAEWIARFALHHTGGRELAFDHVGRRLPLRPLLLASHFVEAGYARA